MSFIEDYFVDEVQIAGRGTPDVYGKYQYTGDLRTASARVTETRGILRRDSGKEHTYKYEVCLPPGDEVAVQDRLTYNGVNFEVLQVENIRFLDGTPSHVAVLIG